jgi:hypothetical protein
MPVSLLVVTTAVNAALYAGLGFLWTAFPLTAFGVRFWPQVFVPATFSVLFGGWIGGVGAGIGIFLADVLYGHHDALLSLLVGVPSNFIGFFLIGWLTHMSTKSAKTYVLLIVSLMFPVLLAAYGIYLLTASSGFGSSQFLVGLVGLIAVIVIIGFFIVRNKWADFEIAASIGLGVGSLIIGAGLVGYSSVFALPAVLGLGSGSLPFTYLYGATAFTYLSEIPFLILLTPPVTHACRAAFPSLRGMARGKT